MAFNPHPKDRVMPDPFDKLLSRFGENICLVTVVIVVTIILKMAGAL